MMGVSFAQGIDSIFGEGVVGVAIEPAFAWLSRSDDRMTDRVRVFAGVTVRRAIAAKRRPTFLTGPQVDPLAADLHTFLALKTARSLDGVYRFDMGACSGNHLISVTPEVSYGYDRKSSAV